MSACVLALSGTSVAVAICVHAKPPLNAQNNSVPASNFEHLRIHRQCSTLWQGEAFDRLTSRSIQNKAGVPLVASGPITASDLPNWLAVARAAESKKAHDVVVLDLREITSFTDYFIICSVANARQSHAVSDEISKQLKHMGELPMSAEGYDAAEWILLDYGDFIVHIFSETARAYYDLERLWRHATKVRLQPEAV